MRLPLNYEEAYRKEFESVYADLAKKYKLPLYPFALEGVAMQEDYNLRDLIHPNKEGHKIIARNLEEWLKKDQQFKELLKKQQ